MRHRMLTASLAACFVFGTAAPSIAGPPGSGAIRGTIIDESTAAPIETICVEAFSEREYLFAETGSDGQYSMSASPGTYSVHFYDCAYPSRYLSETYDDVERGDEATPVNVLPGQETIVDAALTLGGGIAGTLSNQDGLPAQTCVDVYDPEQGWVGGTRTEEDGTYAVGGLRDGAYAVQFGLRCADFEPRPGPEPKPTASPTAVGTHTSSSSPVPPPPSGEDYGFVPEWYDDQPTFETATPVEVVLGQTTAGIDATLAPAGAIVGTVIADETGDPISDVCVDASTAEGAFGGYGYASGGEFVITGLVPGGYVVNFYDCAYPGRYESEFYDDVALYNLATLVPVVGGEASSISAGLATMELPDLAVTGIDVEPVRLQTDAAEVPGPGTQRTVTVHVSNLGDAEGNYIDLSVWARTASDDRVQWIGGTTMSLTPDEDATREFRWNANRSVGDVTVYALACGYPDSDRGNDLGRTSAYSIVGGTGIGLRLQPVRDDYAPWGCEDFPYIEPVEG